MTRSTVRLFAATLAFTLAAALPSAAEPAATPALAAAPIRIGLMADFTGLPFLVAEQEGLFAVEGVQVEFKIFRSAVERDAALQAGALDGCNADVIAAIANLRGGFDVRIVASALNRFSLVAGPSVVAEAKKAGREPTVADLSGASIGISKSTVIEYVLDTLMAGAGVRNYRKTDVARIPVRLELLLQGKLEAASLPLPFDELATAEGCVIVADSTTAGLDPDLFMFYRSDLAGRSDAYRALWRAVDRSRAFIAANPDKYRPLLSARLGFSDDQARLVVFPAFPKYAPTSAAEITRASAWMTERGLIAAPIAAADIVATGILP
jgi:NitT/TauT family transport system substrate-binding protein